MTSENSAMRSCCALCRRRPGWTRHLHPLKPIKCFWRDPSTFQMLNFKHKHCSLTPPPPVCVCVCMSVCVCPLCLCVCPYPHFSMYLQTFEISLISLILSRSYTVWRHSKNKQINLNFRFILLSPRPHLLCEIFLASITYPCLRELGSYRMTKQQVIVFYYS